MLSPLLSACPYPSALIHIDRGVRGSGFYPGARGHLPGDNPTIGIMLLGRDFGLLSYYERRSRIPNGDESMYTWRRTRDCILPSLTGIGWWATNYLLGARRHEPASGNLKQIIQPEEWGPYEGFCWTFLAHAVLLQKPKVVVVLGGDNEEDLRRPDRLDSDVFTFRTSAGEHTSKIIYAPHPSSLRSRVAQEKALTWYASLVGSLTAGR